MICETLQSEVTNFTKAFFGDVIKTDGAPGVVNWELPCGLDIGLPGDPRGFDEGVSCYFLRLWREEIAKLAGPAGLPGARGAAGHSGYSVSLSSFSQPLTPSPFMVRVAVNPVLKPNEIVYIDRSGWYQVLWVDEVGNLTISLIQPMLGAVGVIPAGRLVIPVGPKGQDQTGPVGNLGQPGDKGAPGPKGPTGDPGADGVTLVNGPTQVNGSWIGAATMTEFAVKPSTPEAKLVDFGGVPAPGDPPMTPAQKAAAELAKVKFKLTSIGKYLFRLTSEYHTVNENARLYTGLVDKTTPANNVSPDPAGTNKFLSGSYTDSLPSANGLTTALSLGCIVTTTANYTEIEWQAFGTACRIDPLWTTVTWVRIE